MLAAEIADTTGLVAVSASKSNRKITFHLIKGDPARPETLCGNYKGQGLFDRMVEQCPAPTPHTTCRQCHRFSASSA